MKDILKQENQGTIQELSVNDTTLTKSAQLPHRFFMYLAFQKLVESSLSGEASKQNNPFHDLVQETVDSALSGIMAEMEQDECFTFAEA